jgi:hypothetical protein
MKIKREYQYLIGGLVVGLIVGVVLGGAGGDGLFGTASDPNSDKGSDAIEIDPSKFYLVDFAEAQNWLESIDPDSKEEIEDDLNLVQDLANTEDLTQYVVDNQTSIEQVLITLQNALMQELSIQGVQNFTTCIGLDRNPYSLSGPGVYLYVQLPEDNTENLPQSFQELSGPRESDILWSTACFKGDDKEDEEDRE